ncbi:MAG: alpha/beta hydrolase [Leptospiraceae bacterium]|nr:alpha/beta hydrolase [Leptospiraceae bacterium]
MDCCRLSRSGLLFAALLLLLSGACASSHKIHNPYEVRTSALDTTATARTSSDDRSPQSAPSTIKRPERGMAPYENSYYLVIDGARIHFRWIPSEGGDRSYVLIHGFAASTFSYRHTIDHLKRQGQEIVAIDLPGYGFSDRIVEGNQSAFRRAEVVWKVLDVLESAKRERNRTQETGRWILVGHSMGGSVISAMAQLQPDRIEYLVYLAGSVRGGPGGLTRFALTWVPGLQSFIAWYAESYMFDEESFQTLLKSAYAEQPSDEAVQGYLQPFQVPDTARSILSSIENSDDGRELSIRKINLPSLLIWGQKDEWVPLERGYELHRDLHRSLLIVLPEAGHCPMETRPHEVHALLDGYHSILVQMRNTNRPD